MTHDVLDTRYRHIKTDPLETDQLEVFVELDITSLDDAGVETSFNASDYHPNAEGVAVLGQVGEQYVISWRRNADELVLTDLDTAAAVPQGTAVGIIEIKVEGPE